MKNFIKALFYGAIITAVIMAVIFASTHHSYGFNLQFNGEIIKPILALGVIMTAVIVTLLIGTLVVLAMLGLLGSALLVGGFIAVVVVGSMLFSGLVMSWPVVLAVVVIWLLVRDKPQRRYHSRY